VCKFKGKEMTAEVSSRECAICQSMLKKEEEKKEKY